ncbi:unnamed protein product [Protopolystoma xenopodis]|uniref:Uncharacterized protein n=1 Tax=Protopolystoma xenopodis TaxID=117903 RepID=A0A448XGP2_9PLAT|nr:unnamed protein product [Protopolystoma xenopodis]
MRLECVSARLDHKIDPPAHFNGPKFRQHTRLHDSKPSTACFLYLVTCPVALTTELPMCMCMFFMRCSRLAGWARRRASFQRRDERSNGRWITQQRLSPPVGVTRSLGCRAKPSSPAECIGHA